METVIFDLKSDNGACSYIMPPNITLSVEWLVTY